MTDGPWASPQGGRSASGAGTGGPAAGLDRAGDTGLVDMEQRVLERLDRRIMARLDDELAQVIEDRVVRRVEDRLLETLHRSGATSMGVF